MSTVSSPTTDLPSRATTGLSLASEDAIPEIDPSNVSSNALWGDMVAVWLVANKA